MVVLPYGTADTVEDPTLDVVGRSATSIDIVRAGFGYLPEVPDWLLTTCSTVPPRTWRAAIELVGAGRTFAEGAYLFHQRMGGPPGVAAGRDG